jgi:two-component system OmpR family sensor kinase
VLLDDLLLLARLDAAELDAPLRVRRADLAELVEEAAAAFRASHPDRPLTVRTDPGGLTLCLDPDRIRQVLDNLLTNAAVHTPPGTPVSVRAAWTGGTGRAGETERGGTGGTGETDGTGETGGTGRTAEVRIEDAGPGIPPADREKIFDRFYRVDKARSRDRGGSGLGLSVAASLIRAHDGTIELDSEPGSTVFTVRLPVREPGHEEAGTAGG